MWVSRLGAAIPGSALRTGLQAGLLAAVAALPAPAAAALQPGGAVINHARLVADGAPLADASVSVRLSSQVSFMRYSPTSAMAGGGLFRASSSYDIAGTQCQGADHYQPAFGAGTSGNLPALPASYPLQLTDYFVVGEPLFLHVQDSSRNLSPGSVDRITLTVTDPLTHDSQAVSISETGPDTGEFIGFLNTDNGQPQPADCVLSVRKGSELWASYNDEALASAALVDPYGVVFDSTSGTRLDGVRVRIVDAATGNPAAVFGDDGAPYPSEVLTGGSVTAGALTYHFAPGEFRFPLVASGQDYRLLLDQLPPGYAAPTALPDAHFASGAVPGGPYVVGAGSRQDDFPVPAGPPVRVDIPVDAASSGLFVVKSAGNSLAAIGDFVPYTVQVLNTQSGSAFTAVELHDRLPPGFRYRAGTLKVDGRPHPDPDISGDGRNLTMSLGTLAAQAAFRVSYVAEISAATPPGLAQNIAWANSGSVVSNQSRAVVTVHEDLMRSRSLLAGRVLSVESCAAADIAAGVAVENARIYLETGRYVLTDARGRWHFDDIRPGSHVLQLDRNGLPANAEIIACENHTRSAASAQSQFVDVQGGTLWQTDFYIRRNKPLHYAMSELQESASLQLRSEKTASGLRFSLDISHAGVDLEQARLALGLPASLRYVPGSLQLNDSAMADDVLRRADGAVEVALGALPGSVPLHRLVWDMQLQATAAVPAQDVSAALSATVGGQAVQLVAVGNRFDVVQPEKLGRVIIFRPRFASFSTELGQADRDWLDDIANDLRDAGELRLEVVGHSDDVKVVPRKGRPINDNYALSAARAQSVADYLRGRLGLPAERVSVSGKGPDEPMADNRTAKGRDTNRRVELRVFAAASTEPLRVDSSVADSGAQALHWTRWEARPVALPETVAAEAEKPAEESAPEQGVLSIRDGDVVATRVQALRVRVDARLAFELALDGKIIPAERVGFTKAEGKTTLMTYIGVDLGEPGRHVLTARGRDPFGNLRLDQSIGFTVAGEITRMRLAPARENIADGRTPVELRIELLDGSGSVVPASVDLRLVSGELRPLVTGDAQRTVADVAGRLPVNADGLVKFAPVTRSGLYNVEIAYGNRLVEKFPVFVRPEKREWILVGLAEGSLAATTLAGNMESAAAAGASDDLWQDGRVAFFAKGRVKGEWLLTLAYDTHREKSESFGGLIDPTRYYTLYADAADPRYDAASREKLYLRIEKDAFYALFGDYDTGMTVTELGRYSRSMTGFKSEYHDSRFDLNVFAADSGQAYRHDELRGNGSSGIYRLRSRNILAGSDKVRIEVRDRYKSEIVLSRQELARFSDYSLDEQRGEIFFKMPIPSQDENFNPVWIVAEYEVESGGGENINAGGRAAVKFADGRAIFGASAVRESSGFGNGSLSALDAEYHISRADVLRAEVAGSQTEDALLGTQSGAATLLEWKRDSQKVKSRLYFREEEAGFGLGQQSASEEGTRKLGAEGRYQFRQDIFFTADIFRQDMLESGARREMLDVRSEYQRDAYTLSAGLRHAAENLRTRDSSTEQLTLGGRYKLPGNKLTLRANGEIGVSGQSDAQDFPDRLLLGADYQVWRNVTLLAEQEWAWSEDYNTQTSRAGVKYQPWKGANFSSHLDHETMESGARLRAGLGLGQRLVLTPEWTMDLGYDQAATLKDGRTSTFNPAQPPVFGPASGDDFWAAFAGANYQHADIKGVGRLERRDAESAEQWNLVGGVYRELNAEMALAAGLTATFADEAAGTSTDRSLLRGSLAWRPDRLRWLLLQQLDYGLDRQEGVGGSMTGQRLVNNLNASRRWQRDQLSLQYGAKYVFATIDDSRVSGFTDLLGGEWRHDLNPRWDVGLRGSMLHSWGPGVMDYSLGVSVGVTPVPNAWLSLGFNFTGFRDSDFSGSEYSAQGLYLKMRFKVDQDSIRQIWNDARGVFGSGAAAPAPEPERKTPAPLLPEQDIDALAAPAAAVVMPALPEVAAAAVAAAPLPEVPLAPVPVSVSANSAAKRKAVTVKATQKPAAAKPALKTAAPARAAPVAALATAAKGQARSAAQPVADTAPGQQQRLQQHRARLKQRMEREARIERLARNERTVERVLNKPRPQPAAVTTAQDKNQVSLERDRRRETRERRERLQREKERAEKVLAR